MSAHFKCGISSSISWKTKRRGIDLFFIVVILLASLGCNGDETSLNTNENGEGIGIEIRLPDASDVSEIGRLKLTATVPELPFQPATLFRVGAGPRAIAVSDLDGDGRRDIVTANSGTNDVSILFGDAAAAGGFRLEKLPLVVGARPAAIAVSDLDGDGWRDIVTANSGTNDVSIFFGDAAAAGGGQAAMFFRVGTMPIAVAVSDLDGDGWRDIVTANSGTVATSDVSVLFGKAETIRLPLSGEPMQFSFDGRIVLAFKGEGEIAEEINNIFIVQGFLPPSPDGVDRVIPNFIGRGRQGGSDENRVVVNLQPVEAEVKISLAEDVGRMLDGILEIPLSAKRVQLMASGKFTTAGKTPFLMTDLTDSARWASSNPNVVSIDKDRRSEVSLEGTGEATITIAGRPESLTVRVTDD